MAEVGSAFVSLLPSAKGFGSKMNSELGPQIDAAGKDGGSRFGKAFGAFAAIGGAAAVGGFLKSAVDSASDLGESASKVSVVFGKQADQIYKTAKTSATSMGLTESAYLGATGSLGNLLVSLDLAPKKAAGMSQEMVKLAGDLASFNNVAPEEALAALQSGLTGETEPLKRFGVNMNDATLKAEALKMGLIKNTKEALDPQTKALAAQSLIMSQTGTAQGDFARTSGGLANQQRILTAQFGDMKATVGGALLPVVTDFVTFLNTKAMPAIGGLGGTFDGLKGHLSTAAGYVSTVWDAFNGGGATVDALRATFDSIRDSLTNAFGGGAGVNVAGLLDTFKTIGTTIASNVLPFVEQAGAVFRNIILPAIAEVAGVVITNLVPVLQAMGDTFQGVVLPAVLAVAGYLIANLWPILKQVADIVTTQVIPIIGQLALFFYGTLYPAVVKIVAAIATNLVPVFDAIFKAITTSVLPAVSKLLTKFQEWLPTIKMVIGVVLKVVGAVLTFAAAILGKVLPVVIKFAGWLIGTLVAVLGTVIGWIIKIIGWVVQFGVKVFEAGAKVVEFVKGLKDKFGDAVEFVKGVPGKIVKALGNLGGLLVDKGKDIITGLWDGIKSMGSWLTDKLISFVTDNIPGPIAKALGISSPSKVMAAQAKWIPIGMAKGIESEARTVQGAMDRIGNGLRVPRVPLSADAFGGAGEAGRGGVNVHIDRVDPHDYRAFMGDLQRRTQRAALGGFA